MEAAAEARGEEIGLGVWDICYMAVNAVIKRLDPSTVLFHCALPIGTPLETLKMVCGPDDDGKPVLTVMFPDED